MSREPITAHGGRYVRDADTGTWRYADSGKPVPGAEDLTISNLYNPPIYGDHVLVPRSLALNEPDLSWCLDYDEGSAADRYDHGLRRGMDRDRNIPFDSMCVSREEWDRRAKEILGMLAPEFARENEIFRD